jgi:hypothetical protein
MTASKPSELTIKTNHVLARRDLGLSLGLETIQWANDLVLKGVTSASACELAGWAGPFQWSVMEELVDEIRRDLDLFKKTENAAPLKLLAYADVWNVAYATSFSWPSLLQLKKWTLDFDLADEIYDFYLLYFAIHDQLDDNSQYYWDGLNGKNWETIARKVARDWIAGTQWFEVNL